MRDLVAEAHAIAKGGGPTPTPDHIRELLALIAERDVAIKGLTGGVLVPCQRHGCSRGFTLANPGRARRALT